MEGNSSINIIYEIDDNGYVVSITLIVKDEESANLISETINNIDKGEECSYGILCRCKTVRVKEPTGNNEINIISSGNEIMINSMALMMMVSILI